MSKSQKSLLDSNENIDKKKFKAEDGDYVE